MANQRTSSEEEVEGYFHNTIWPTECKRQYEPPTALYSNMTGECGPATIPSTQPSFQQQGNQENLILSAPQSTQMIWNVNNTNYQSPNFNDQGYNPSSIYSNNNAWTPNDNFIIKKNPSSTTDSSGKFYSNQGSQSIGVRSNLPSYNRYTPINNPINNLNNLISKFSTESCQVTSSNHPTFYNTTNRYMSSESATTSATTNSLNPSVPVNKGIFQEPPSQFFQDNRMESVTNSNPIKYEEYTPLLTTINTRTSTADVIHSGTQSESPLLRSLLAVPQNSSIRMRGASPSKLPAPYLLPEKSQLVISTYSPISDQQIDQSSARTRQIQVTTKNRPSITDQPSTLTRTSPESISPTSDGETGAHTTDPVALTIRAYKREIASSKKSTKRRRRENPIELTEEAGRYVNAFSQASLLIQPKDQEGVQEAIRDLIRKPESTLDGWKNVLNKSPWKMITELICRSGAYWETELGCICVNCVISQKTLRNKSNCKKIFFHELEAKVWISGNFCNNCYTQIHEVMECQLSPDQAWLFKQFVEYIQPELDPILREGCLHLGIKVTIQEVLIKIPLPYAYDLRRTHKEVRDTYTEAQRIYQFLMFLSDTQVTKAELTTRMFDEIRMISISDRLYEGLCEIAGQCPSEEHTDSCPKEYMDMKMRTYWYLFQFYYMFMNQRLIVEPRVIGVNPITILRHRELTGTCIAFRQVHPLLMEEVTKGYESEKTNIRNILTKSHPEGLASRIFSYLELRQLEGFRESVLTNYLTAAENRYNYKLSALRTENAWMISPETIDLTEEGRDSSDNE
ncbi:hypothetical protein KQX54_000718 [Cotesia glomerata]|uniref:Uncharacterized protein n=1 Tax=Cotesia glomerata TaxID=32391 RepID=A0AAV7HU00_COTGL|nr:hypothetical protein KQX54_000718 [Cotesia glomerata]